MKIEAKGLVFSYKKKSPKVLDGVFMTLESGKCTALIGANGSGKTTLTKVLLGLNKETGGAVYFDGADVKKVSAGKRAARIGYLFQNPDMQLFAATVGEELTFPFEITGDLNEEKKKETEELLLRFGLKAAENRFPLTLSGGEKQRLALATIMTRKIEYLIFDEPTASVDKEGVGFISEFISEFVENGGGALVITHDEDFLESVKPDVTYVIKEGKVYEK